MIQPFEKFKLTYVERLKKLNKKYLVTQICQVHSYQIELDQIQKIHLLVSDYEDLSRAKTHWNAVKERDKFAAIIHLENSNHCRKVQEMLLPESSFELYFAVIKSTRELENMLNLQYKDHIRRWIDLHTTWRIKKDAVIRPSLLLIFGILYIYLKFGGQSIRVKFEEIEKS